MATLPNNPEKFDEVSFDFSTATTHDILSAVAGRIFNIKEVFIKSFGDVNVTFRDDTPQDVYPIVNLDNKAGFVLPFINDKVNNHFSTARGKKLQILLSGAVRVTGHIKYNEVKSEE